MAKGGLAGEIEYNEKCLKEILNRTEGKIPPELMEERQVPMTIYLGNLWCDRVVRGVFRASGSFLMSYSGEESIDMIRDEIAVASEHKKRFEKEGVIAEIGDSYWGCLYEHGAGGDHLEEIPYYDPHDPKSVKGVSEMLMSAGEDMIKRKFGLPFLESGGDLMHNMSGPVASNYHLWMRKIKNAFDPNTASDPTFYISPEE